MGLGRQREDGAGVRIEQESDYDPVALYTFHKGLHCAHRAQVYNTIMVRRRYTLGLVFILFTSSACAVNLSPTFAVPDYSEIVKYTGRSIVRLVLPLRPVLTPNGIVMSRPVCSAFMIDQLRHFALTAAHCAEDGVEADQAPTTVVYLNGNLDLAVLQVAGSKPALRYRLTAPKQGQPVFSLGFGYGQAAPIFRQGYVSEVEVSYRDEPGVWLTLDNAFVGGQSGAPVLDINGLVVGVVNSSDERSGWGRPISTILQETQQYWAPF